MIQLDDKGGVEQKAEVPNANLETSERTSELFARALLSRSHRAHYSRICFEEGAAGNETITNRGTADDSGSGSVHRTLRSEYNEGEERRRRGRQQRAARRLATFGIGYLRAA